MKTGEVNILIELGPGLSLFVCGEAGAFVPIQFQDTITVRLHVKETDLKNGRIRIQTKTLVAGRYSIHKICGLVTVIEAETCGKGSKEGWHYVDCTAHL